MIVKTLSVVALKYHWGTFSKSITRREYKSKKVFFPVEISEYFDRAGSVKKKNWYTKQCLNGLETGTKNYFSLFSK